MKPNDLTIMLRCSIIRPAYTVNQLTLFGELHVVRRVILLRKRGGSDKSSWERLHLRARSILPGMSLKK